MSRLLPVAMLMALVLTACGSQETPAEMPPPEVGVVVAKAEDLPLQKELVGRLAPIRSADVRARVPGVLQKRVYTEGSDVREGDVLFNIDPAPLQAALGTAQASLAQAQANHANARSAADRARQLAPTNYISKSDFDNAIAAERSTAAAVEAARAAVRAAQIDLGYATVRAPISGRAGKQQVTEGALVGQGTATLLTTVDQIDQLYVNFSISVAELDQIRAAREAAGSDGAEVTVMLPNGSEHPHKGVLDFSGDMVDPATGAISMRALIPNPDGRLLPGTYVTLHATLGVQQGVYAVPQTAVQRDAGSAYVLVVDGEGIVKRKNVRTGAASNGNWIVESGLADGDRVIVAGLQKVELDKPATVAQPQQDGNAAPAANPEPAPAAPEAAADETTAPAASQEG